MADEVMDAPVEMNEVQAAEAMAKAGLFSDPSEPKRKAPPKDPSTGKFTKANPSETPNDSENPEVEAEPEVEVEAEPETPAEAEVRKLKVKLDGMEQEVPEPEVVAGYLRQSDYTKKTQAHAERVKRFEAEEVAAVREEREYYAQRVQALEEALETLAPAQEPDWAQLGKELSPEDFGQRFQAWQKGREQKGRLEQEHARVRELQSQDEARFRAARLRAEQEKLELAIPELKDPVKGKVLREDLMAYANSIGFTDDELSGVEDHRALVILNESRLYRESQKRRPTVEAKVAKAIDGMKPSGAHPPAKAKEAAQATARLRATGSVDDAAAAMKAAKIFG